MWSDEGDLADTEKMEGYDGAEGGLYVLEEKTITRNVISNSCGAKGKILFEDRGLSQLLNG
jgi:hypothetical protein